MAVITKTGSVEVVVAGPIVDTTSSAAPLTGLTTIKAAVFRASDRKFLDWSTLAFTTTPVTEYQALTELDAVRTPGIYYLAIDTSTFVGANAKDKYFAYISQQGASTAANALQLGEFRIGEIVDAVEAYLDALISSRLATSGYTAPPTAANNATAVWSQALPGAFTSGQAGFIVGTNLDALVSSRLATTGYTAPPTAGANATAVWQTLVPGSFTVGQAGYVVGNALDATVSSRLASGSYTTPPTVVQVSTQVRADLITDHGSGTWTTATGFSTLTAAQVWQTVVPGAFSSGQAGNTLGNLPTTAAPTAAAISAVVNADLTTVHGAGSYQTATGFATSGALTTVATTLGTKASQTSMDAAQADLVLIKGPQFGANSGLDNIAEFVHTIDQNVDLTNDILGISNVIGATVAGSTLSAVHTDYTNPSNDNKWKDQQIVIQDSAGQNSEGFTRNIVSHASGVFIVDPPLPQLPGLDDPVRILATLAVATPADVTAATGPLATALAKLLGVTIAYQFTVAAGSTASSVLTNATQADNFFRYTTLLIVGAGGVKAHPCTVYNHANGEFVFDNNFPFVPQAGDIAYVLAAGTALSPELFYSHTDDTLLDAIVSHGDSAWATATNFATPTDVTNARDHVEAAVPVAVWTTQLPGSFATGSAGKLVATIAAAAPPDAPTIAAAVWNALEGTRSPGTFGYDMIFMRMLITNRLEEIAGNPGSAVLYADDATTVWKTWTLRDGTGGPVTQTVGEPARRGVAT